MALDVVTLDRRQAMQKDGQDGAHGVHGLVGIAPAGHRALFEGPAREGKRMDGPASRWPRIARQQTDVKVRVDLLNTGYVGDVRFDRSCVGGAGDVAVEQDSASLDQDVNVRDVEAAFERSE
jgi:hypothetical protein